MTPQQHNLYQFIDAYWREYGFAPTYEAMCMGIGVKGRGQIHRLVHRMVSEGVLEIRLGRKRCIRCVPQGTQDYRLGYSRGYEAGLAAQKKDAA